MGTSLTSAFWILTAISLLSRPHHFWSRHCSKLPAGPLLGAAHHPLAGAILPKCQWSFHFLLKTLCKCPHCLQGEIHKALPGFPGFGPLCPCLPFQAHSIPFCCECSVLWSFWMVSHPLLPLHWFSPLSVLSYHLHTAAQSLKCLWSFRAQLMHPSPSLSWEPLLRVPQPPGLPFQDSRFTREIPGLWQPLWVWGCWHWCLLLSFSADPPVQTKFYLMTIQGDRRFIAPRCCCQCLLAQLQQRPGMGPGSPGAQRPLELPGGQ